MQTQSVLIYQDYIHNNGQLYSALVHHYGHDAVGYCDADDILSGILTPAVGLFIIPGGADLYYCEKLNGEGNAKIRAYVENGGSYLGICAGAYYACRAIEWGKDTAQEITGPRELQLYDGMAIGPIPAYLEDGDIEKSWRAAALLFYDDGEQTITGPVLYDGGPFFTDGQGEILARYQDGSTAIIECVIGKGRAVLSSPHIEAVTPVLYQHRNNSHAHDNHVARQMKVDETSRHALWEAVLNRLYPQQRADRQNHAA